MSKDEILQELPKLRPEERVEVLDRLYQLSEQDLLAGAAISAGEKTLLDREWQEYKQNPDTGAPWAEVWARVGKRQ